MIKKIFKNFTIGFITFFSLFSLVLTLAHLFFT